MKFGQKIFLITFSFILICINIIGIIIINNNHKNNINTKISNDISNISNLVKLLRFYDVNGLNGDLMRDENLKYEIYEDNNIIFSNLLLNTDSIKEKIKPTEDNIKTIINNETLFMSVKDNQYNIIISEDLKDIFKEREEQINFFVKVSFVSSFFIALFLYIIIYFLTRKIDKLNRAVNQIAKGDYSTRVKNLGKDEIGMLAEQFNKMADSVDTNIKEIKQVSENRKNFINNITHEIRTPLTSIIGFSSLMKNGKVNNENDIIEYSSKIYDEGIYLNSISQRLMDIILLENQKVKLELINISETIQETIKNIKYNFRDVEIYNEIEADIWLYSDKTLLQSLVTNIIKNAIMAYEKNSKKGVFVQLVKEKDGQINLRIIDGGRGMTEEELKKVLEPFYTLNKDRNREISGMGLGLPLCMKICETINATLYIKSKFGEGTIIDIKFKNKEEGKDEQD